jgi:hypothetical protein
MRRNYQHAPARRRTGFPSTLVTMLIVVAGVLVVEVLFLVSG